MAGLMGLSGVARAGSAVAAPVWRITALADTTVAPGGQLIYEVEIRNVGDEEASSTVAPITVSGVLPQGETVVEAHESIFNPSGVECSPPGPDPRVFSCTYPGSIRNIPGDIRRLGVVTAVEPSAAREVLPATFQVAGGGAAVAQTVASSRVTTEAPSFGIAAFDVSVSGDRLDTPFTQAAGHPYEETTNIDFNTFTSPEPLKGDLRPVEDPKDIEIHLRPGFTGNTTALAKCTGEQLANGESLEALPLCPLGSQVGTTMLRVNGTSSGPLVIGPLPVFNMVAPPDAPAELGFNVASTIVTINIGVRTGSDYGLTAHVDDVSQGLDLASTSLTLWGVPSDPSHDPERACPGAEPPSSNGPSCQAPSGSEAALLRNPTSCSPVGEGLPMSIRADSWQHPGVWSAPKTVYTHTGKGYPYPEAEWGPRQGTTGCEKVPFEPGFTDLPSTGEAGAPAGFSFDVTLPQPDEGGTIAESDLRKAVVRLPAGVRISPSSADGLQACSPAQIGLHDASKPSCPDASKLGTASIVTPALEKPLTGSIYLATPHENPFGTLMAIYIVTRGSGVTIKLAGKIELDPATGQLTTTIDENPQQPFNDVHLEFDGGPRAPLTTPEACGTYTTNARFTGWNGKTVESNPTFTITTGAGGNHACTAPGFTPSFTAGTTNPIAGRFSPLVLSFSRNDSEQQIVGLTDTFPPGVSAVLKGVAQCSDAQVKAAEAGTGGCPQASRIGSVTVASGAGPDPYFLKGSVYLTGSYNNGPFGEAVVVPAVAGPFDLGNVVVRGSIRIDPHTAQPTVVSDPFPQFVKDTGIPTDVRRVDVNLDRPGFTFNPTNCSELHATGTLTGSGGAVANVSSRFEAAECRSLAFHPGFRVSTAAKTSRPRGAALHVTVTSGAGQANIRSVHVSLPKSLPSRLTTLQKACADSVFSANPAACPAESRVGYASAVTPLLAARLAGPVYFVSHGGAKFPDLTVVLQGEGVTVQLSGETFINGRTNVTSSTFRTVPDVPIERFDLTLPQGRFSALAATASLCKGKLSMPTRIVGQNGAVVQRTTRIAVGGCPKHRKAARKQHAKHTRKHS
jgi:hypothetical protein